jgi:hypothetical protein
MRRGELSYAEVRAMVGVTDPVGMAGAAVTGGAK